MESEALLGREVWGLAGCPIRLVQGLRENTLKRFFAALFAAVVGPVLVQTALAGDLPRDKEEVLYSFCSLQSCADGQNPEASLIYVGGTFYGTTYGGGPYSGGTIFSLDAKTGAEKVLYPFCSQQSCADGQYPQASLIDVNGTLYGTTSQGGAYCSDIGGCGSVFKFDLNAGTMTTLYSFCHIPGCNDGAYPFAAVIDAKGTLYGTTAGGGRGGGIVFSLDPNTGLENILYSFGSSGINGSAPDGGLIDVGGVLYSTTVSGGNFDQGTVFSLDLKTGAEVAVYSFCSLDNCSDGSEPMANLIDVQDTLYGTTNKGGHCSYKNGCGTVFSFDAKTGTEKVLYSFCGKYCMDGDQPSAGLINVNGTLYGTSTAGGTASKYCRKSLGCGTVFAVDLTTGAENVLYSFCSQQDCADGEYPASGLTEVKGTLYGTTVQGGANGRGTVFAIRLQSGSHGSVGAFDLRTIGVTRRRGPSGRR